MISEGQRQALLGAVDQLKDYIHQMAEVPVEVNCVNCENFDADTELCALYNARPPAATIVKGCDSWVLDIPF
jgi:hypothetical protein